MTIYAPAMGNQPPAAGNKHLLFIAAIVGLLCTFCIYNYSANNLELLGLSPETQKARMIELIVFIIGQTFLSFAIGRTYRQNPAWAYKFGFILLVLFIVDFSSSYQARNAINQHQTLTKSATEEQAKLIAAQISVSQNTAKELADSAQKQRDNKLITGSANTAQKAAKQADSAIDLIKMHGEAIKTIKPTESDTFGVWTSNVIFLAVLALYLLNDSTWLFIGYFSNHAVPAPTPPKPNDSASSTPSKPSDSVSKKEKARKSAEKPAMQFDTATTGAASHRYQRIRKMVADKKVKPLVTHIAAIQGENLNTYRAKKYLQAMVDDGLLLLNAEKQRFEYRPEADPRQMNLGGL